MLNNSLRVKDTYRPTKMEVSSIYAKRIWNWRKNSWPFISGDAFSSIADVEFKPPFLRDFGNFKKYLYTAEIVFLQGENLEELLSEHAKYLNCKVIIAGNSDFEHTKISNNLPKSLRHFFLQNNSMGESEMISTIPIGVENLRFGRNGNTRLLSHQSQFRMNDKVMIGPFGNTHVIRNTIVEYFENISGPWEVFRGFADVGDYVNYSRGFKYIVAPRGNGVDTHRLWESLYRGQWPIIQKNSWTDFLSTLNLPIKFVNEWTEPYLKEIICKSESDLSFEPLQIPELWMPYWKKRVLNKI